jgi:Icc-related predicted phosphoesterase
MKLRIISDMHNEFRNEPIQMPIMEGEKEQVLIIAGDFSPLKHMKNYKSTLDEYTERFKAVLFVLGNHEYYGFKIDNIRVSKVFEDLNLKDNFKLLTRFSPSVKIDDTRFVGATLWTDLGRSSYIEYIVQEKMNDFKKITWVEKRNGISSYSKFKTKNWFGEFVKDFEYIKNEIQNNPNDKIIVVTHYGPSFKSADTRYLHEMDLQHGYLSNLDNYIESLDNVPLWVHGHIHEKKNYTIGKTQIIVNPFAYPGEFGSDIDKTDTLKFVIEK